MQQHKIALMDQRYMSNWTLALTAYVYSPCSNKQYDLQDDFYKDL